MVFRRMILTFFIPFLLSAAVRAETPLDSPAAVPPAVNFEPRPEHGDDVRMFQGIPGLERSAGGRLWATWYGGGVTEDRHNYIMLVTSGDDGKTWSDLKLVIDPDRDGPVRAFDPCPWVDPDGKLWLFWAQATRGGGGDPFTFAINTESPDDEDPVWSEPQLIHDGVMMCKPTVLSDGTWLLPTAIWRREGSCRVVASTDNGKTWNLRGTATVPDPKDRNCDEPMIVERGDGSLWLLVRTRYGIGESVSCDGGRSWTPISPWNVEHPAARFFIRRLNSGNLLLVKHGPLDERTARSHLTAYVSEDDGNTWQGGFLLDERTGGSYPDGVQSQDGVIYIIYDYDRLGEKKIYMATFTQRDILAGECASDQVRLRVVVNRATGVNPRRAGKASAAKIEFASNDDGRPILSGEAAIEPIEGRVEPIKPGAVLFSDRSYQLHDIPEALADKRYVLGSIDSIRVECKQPGPVFVATPSPGKNADSLAEELAKQGFTKVKLSEFLLFNERNAPGNVCTIYQKMLEAGEKFELGKWGVVIF